MNLAFERHLNDRHLCLVVAGEVDLSTVGRLETEIRASLSNPDLSGLVLDLAHVTFLDSDGIRVLLVAQQAAQLGNVTFRVGGVSHRVRRVLEIAGVLGILTEQ